MSKVKGDVSFLTSGLLKWQMTTFFSRFIPPFCDKCRTMHKEDHRSCAWTFNFDRKLLQIFAKIHHKVSLSLFVNKNVRTHLTIVVNCFFRVAHRKQFRELTQQDGWKTWDATMTKKCRGRPCIPNLTRHFFVILPS